MDYLRRSQFLPKPGDILGRIDDRMEQVRTSQESGHVNRKMAQWAQELIQEAAKYGLTMEEYQDALREEYSAKFSVSESGGSLEIDVRAAGLDLKKMPAKKSDLAIASRQSELKEQAKKLMEITPAKGAK
jgi:hypothetical protein